MTFFSIGESRPKRDKLLAKAIMWIEDVDYSHVFVTWKDHLGLRWVAEARGGGVRLISNVEFRKDNEVVNVYRYRTTDAYINSLIEYVWKTLNRDYGYKHLYGLAEMRILNKLYRSLGIDKKAVNHFKDGEASLICCEFAVRCAEVALGADLQAGSNLEQWALREMREFNLHNGEKRSRMQIDRINGVR